VALTFFGLVQRVGPKRFLQIVMAASPADLKVLEDEEVMNAMIRGSEACVSPTFAAHVAWAAEVSANQSRDWSDVLHACRVPITLFHGHQDAFSSFATVQEYAAAIPNIRLVDLPDTGQLMYAHTSRIFDAIEARMQAQAGAVRRL
jgi:pimeloyl-ACP methyl ester carboxylesterase